METTPTLEQCDNKKGCCFWIDGRAVEQDEFQRTRSHLISSFVEEGKLADLNPPLHGAVHQDPAVTRVSLQDSAT